MDRLWIKLTVFDWLPQMAGPPAPPTAIGPRGDKHAKFAGCSSRKAIPEGFGAWFPTSDTVALFRLDARNQFRGSPDVCRGSQGQRIDVDPAGAWDRRLFRGPLIR